MNSREQEEANSNIAWSNLNPWNRIFVACFKTLKCREHDKLREASDGREQGGQCPHWGEEIGLGFIEGASSSDSWSSCSLSVLGE